MGDFSQLMLNPAAGAGTGNIPLLIGSTPAYQQQWDTTMALMPQNIPALPAGTVPQTQPAPAPATAPASQAPVAQMPTSVAATPTPAAAPAAVAQPAPAPVAQPVAAPAPPPAAAPPAQAAQPAAAPPAPAAPGGLIGTLGSDVASGGKRRRGISPLLTGLGGSVESLGG